MLATRFSVATLSIFLVSAAGCGGTGNVPSSSRHDNDGASASVKKTGVAERLPSPDCPERALGALPLIGDSARRATALVLSHEAPRLMPKAKAVPAPRGGARGTEATFACGTRIGDRTEVVFVHRRAFDHGRNRSASLGQGVFWVSRFEDGYRVWGSPHP